MDCKCLIHPFQNDPGTSQSQRLIEELLTRAPQIDGRSLADLLSYFVEMAGHINYFDTELKTFDWKPFFKKSIPFTIASIINYKLETVEESFIFYNNLFEKMPTATGLQVNANFMYYRFICTVNSWYSNLQEDPDTAMSVFTVNIIKNKLQQPLKLFISYINAGVISCGMKSIDFSSLLTNNIWGLTLADITKTDCTLSSTTGSSEKRMVSLFKSLQTIFPAFVNAMKLISTEAEKNLEKSFAPLKDELQKKHSPHLGLIFTFLNAYKELQNDLNQFTKKHLDYFYKTILLFKSANATPDQAHIVFEVQKQLKNYLLKKGIKIKDGKDDNKQEILFALDDEILITKTTIGDRRNLFVNNRPYKGQSYIEGVYMAPVAGMADGVGLDFLVDPKDVPTLGGKYSKWIDPPTKLVKPYPNARLGFVLGSPVLYMQAGSTRTVDISIDCIMDKTICNKLLNITKPAAEGCCGSSVADPKEKETFPIMFDAEKLKDAVNIVLGKTYYYLNQDILKEIIKKGISNDVVERLRDKFLKGPNPHYNRKFDVGYCNSNERVDIYEKTLEGTAYTGPFAKEIELLKDFIKPLKALNVLFSGANEWIEPTDVSLLALEAPDPVPPTSSIPQADFKLHIKAILNPDKDAITFYDKEKLKEDLGTTQPLVKIELNDKIKLTGITFSGLHEDSSDADCCAQNEKCCLIKDEKKEPISLYHFFRDVMVAEMKEDKDIITVNVCGLKNFIVQNDESVMDVNIPMMIFGARPKLNSNFYIGSEEIFLKKWTEVWINLKWSDKPENLTNYYVGYQDQYWDPVTKTWIDRFKVLEENFQVQISCLQDGTWFVKNGDVLCGIDGQMYNKLFFKAPVAIPFCFNKNLAVFNRSYDQQFHFLHDDFQGILAVPVEKPTYKGISKRDVNTRSCFLRLTLKCQDFRHDQYPFVLARQMDAAAKLPVIVPGAVYHNLDPSTGVAILSIQDIFKDIQNSFAISDGTHNLIGNTQDEVLLPNPPETDANKIATITPNFDPLSVNFVPPPNPNIVNFASLKDATEKLHDILKTDNDLIDKFKNIGAEIPKEPYTPTLSGMGLDYVAVAHAVDINLIHLYPYTSTYKQETLKLQPSLFPTFCDEGSLFLGLKDLVPGDNLNILFQLAEATADSEENKEEVFWYYLDGNIWKPLRTGFEVTDDATKNLTSSGVIKFSLPANMTMDNTVMPKDLYWIKAVIAKNSRAVSETTAIVTQAILATFTNDDANDKLRLGKPLLAGSLAKLSVADASVKTIAQPFDSFNGAVPEAESLFYIRVSETLRHKGRAIQAFDYERIALQAFPKLFKVKCINHSFSLSVNDYDNDFPYAPGYISLAVIPDLNKLKAGNSFQPMVPVSMLEDIDTYIRKRISPFVRFKSVNPRYEKINFCVSVQLLKGKDKNYCREKIKQDIREMLAPWAIGKYDKLSFGQCVYRSDIIQLLESSDYTDFITDLRMYKEKGNPDSNLSKVCPVSPRSILIAGDIEVCINDPVCEDWTDAYTTCNNVVIKGCNNPAIAVMPYCEKSGNIK